MEVTVRVREGRAGNGANWERIQLWAACPRKIRGFKVIQGCSRLNFFSPAGASAGEACRSDPPRLAASSTRPTPPNPGSRKVRRCILDPADCGRHIGNGANDGVFSKSIFVNRKYQQSTVPHRLNAPVSPTPLKNDPPLAGAKSGQRPVPPGLPKHHKSLVPALLQWYAANARDLPWRRTRDPYAIWVSEIMLQQTQVKTVIPFWERWRRELPTLAAVAKASPDRLHKLWEGLGYYTRVRHLQQAAQVIVERHGGQFPKTFEEVLALPGIGRYTAGAICSIAFNQPTPILDGNVMRVLTRVFGMAENPREKAVNRQLWALAEALVLQAAKPSGAKPPLADGCSRLNQSLMELGALVCTPRNAQCEACPLRSECVAFREGRVESLPNLGRRTPVTARRFVAFVIERHGKFLVRQRPSGVVNAHLWEFPNVEIAAGMVAIPEIFRAELGVAAAAVAPLATVRHSITRYRITLEAFRVAVHADLPPGRGAVWKTPAQLRPLAFASAHRKLLRAAGQSAMLPA